jgi:hypothetical protein
MGLDKMAQPEVRLSSVWNYSAFLAKKTEQRLIVAVRTKTFQFR